MGLKNANAFSIQSFGFVGLFRTADAAKSKLKNFQAEMANELDNRNVESKF